MVPRDSKSILFAALFCLGFVSFVALYRSDGNWGKLSVEEHVGLRSRGVPFVVDSTKPSSFSTPEILVKAGVVAKESSGKPEVTPAASKKVAKKVAKKVPKKEIGEVVASNTDGGSVDGNCDASLDLPSYCECLHETASQSDMELFSMNTATVDGTSFRINTYKTKDIVSKSIKDYGSWELATSREFIKAMNEHYTRLKANDSGIEKKDVKFLDIGANIGWYSILIASMGFGVISVEPMLTNLKGFKHSICENNLQDLITIHETALSEEPIMCKLVSITYNVGDGTIVCGDDWSSSDPAHPTYVFRQNVTFSRLDDLISESENIGLVKMDVEGYEAHVVGGGPKTLLHGGVPKIMSEWGPWLMHDAKSDPVEFLETFQNAGYIVRRDGFDTGQILSTRAEFDHLVEITEIGAVFFENL
ncbi:hypothetical protein BSKO_05728 [Bryopsis sp. KO-2023]|nr:hypothetical protein BSKO_05728 [Bryopsis sp. KO-2023]